MNTIPGPGKAGLLALVVFAWSLFIVPLGLSAATSGLDSRPVNATCLAFDRPATNASVELQRVFPSLSVTNLVVLTQPPGDASYWYFVKRDGVIGRFANTADVSAWDTVLNLSMGSGSGKVTILNDGGLVQLLFHPDYPADPRVFVNYSTTGSYGEANDMVVSSFEMLPGGAAIDELSEVKLIVQPRGQFHQGGFMSFGPDGLLYFGFGDGAPQADPDNNSQNLLDFRGSILRIDVDNVPTGEVYGIPADNPYAGNPRCGPVGNLAPCPEIYAHGFRNPFRGDIDQVTQDVWVADVGYSSIEEVNKVVKRGNYGWNVYEATLCREFSGSCDDPELLPPVIEYSHDNGQCAVIGGYVYRGDLIPELQGRYLFADFCTSKVSAVQYDSNGDPFEEILLPGGSGIGQVRTFARDVDGELYVVTSSAIYRILGTGGSATTAAPATLTQTGCFEAADPTKPALGLIPYDLNSALWSDGASKQRWMALPEGATVDIDTDGDLLFPAGTVLVKEFSYGGVPHETRLLVRHLDGIWAGYSYEWRADGSDADLLAAGLVKDLSSGHAWTYPSRAECLSCHTDSANFSLGPEVAQLNREILYPQTMRIANQLETLDQIGVFTAGLPALTGDLPAYAELDQTHHSVDYRARSYLHSNCSGCHRPGETTQAPMDFRFSTPMTAVNACDIAPAFGDLGVAGAMILSPGDPGLSVTRLRDGSRDPLMQMPPLATALIHDEWIALLDAWISDTTVCDPDIDSDLDGVFDKLDNCPAATNSSQRDTDRNGIGDACELTANAGVDQFVADLGADGTEQVTLVGSGSTSPDLLDPINRWTWSKDGAGLASGETATISLPTGVHIIDLEIATEQGSIATDQVMVTVNEPVPLSIGINDINVAEDGGQAVFTVRLSTPSTDVVTVQATTVDGSAESPADYTALSGTLLTFNPGETSQLLAVALFDDNVLEATKTFTVQLGNAVNASLGRAIGTATVFDNESIPAVSIDDVVVVENDTAGVARFTVRLSNPSSEPVTVEAATADNSAVSVLDYMAVAPTALTFNPGETSQTFDVAIVDDALKEGVETFRVVLGNPVNAVPGDTNATGMILDDELSVCGAPAINAGTDHAVFLWRDCASGEWQARFSPGGVFSIYAGSVDSDLGFSSVVASGLESSDTLAYTLGTAPGRIDYEMRMGSSWLDGFRFAYPVGANVCFGVDAPAGTTVLAGADRLPVPVPVNLDTMGPCGTAEPRLSIDDVTVAEDSGMADFTVSLSLPGTELISVAVQTSDGSAVSPDDFTAVSATTLTFNPGETIQTLSVLIEDDALQEGTETFSVLLGNAVNASLGDASGTGRIVDNEVSACGEPAIDAGSDRAVFVWEDCVSGVWHARFSPGGANATYIGGVDSDQGFSSVVPVSVESSDVLDFTTGTTPGRIDYTLRMGSRWLDGFDFSYPAGANVCFGVDQPAGTTVLVGAGRTPVTLPFDPQTLGPCNEPLPALSIDDVSVAEGSGVADFTISLSAPGTELITVDVQTADGSAVAADDFTAVPVTTLMFNPGETIQTFSVLIQDDALPEGTETFSVVLDNLVNAVPADVHGIGTILDDEVSACGEPAFDAGTDRAVFLWQDCVTGVWHARFSPGGANARYRGAVDSDQGFSSVVPVSVESSDVLDFATGTAPGRIDYTLRMGSRWLDGFDFSYPAGSNVCFGVNEPAGTTVLVGAGRTPVALPLALQTLGGC